MVICQRSPQIYEGTPEDKLWSHIWPQEAFSMFLDVMRQAWGGIEAGCLAANRSPLALASLVSRRGSSVDEWRPWRSFALPSSSWGIRCGFKCVWVHVYVQVQEGGQKATGSLLSPLGSPAGCPTRLLGFPWLFLPLPYVGTGITEARFLGFWGFELTCLFSKCCDQWVIFPDWRFSS